MEQKQKNFITIGITIEKKMTMMESILHDYALLMRRQASPVAFESLFRHSFLLQTDGAPSEFSDDMLWFVRLDEPGPPVDPEKKGPKSIMSSFSSSEKFPPIVENVFVRRRTPGKPLDSDINPEQIDWAKTVGLNLIVHWRYDLVVAIVPQRKPVPGRGMIVHRHVRREVFASPSKTFFKAKGHEVELDFPNIYFNVEDFEDAFGNQTLPKAHGLAVQVEAHPGLTIFKGVLTFDQISDTFARKASGLRLNRQEFVPLVGPGRKGRAEMAINVVAQDPTSIKKDIVNRTSDPYQLQCAITFVSIDFASLCMALLQVTDDTYIPGPSWLYFPSLPLSDADQELLNSSITSMASPGENRSTSPLSNKSITEGSSPPTPSLFASFGKNISDIFRKKKN